LYRNVERELFKVDLYMKPSSEPDAYAHRSVPVRRITGR
jgi:hypothetical protein